MKILVDTNVILDFFLSRVPHYKTAKNIFELIYQEKVNAFTTASSFTDLYYIIAKRLGNYKAREILQDLINMLGIIAVDGDDCNHALGLPITDYEDALVVTCAGKQRIDWIISNDQGFLKVDNSLIQVISAADFLVQFDS